MEQNEEQTQLKENLVFNEEIKEHLKAGAKWGKFLAIMGYIGIGVMLLVSIIVMAMGPALSRMNNANVFERFRFVFIIYIVIAIVYLFPLTYLYRFCDKALNGIKYNDQNQINGSIKNLRLFFQFKGILLIIILAIYVLITVFAIAFSSMLMAA